MKKMIFLLALIVILQQGYAQCDTFQIPYVLNAENTTVPQLPDCASSYWENFGSQEVFESISGPVEGFSGQLLAYDTFAELAGVPTPVSATLTTSYIQFEQGEHYKIAYKYKCGNPEGLINYISVTLFNSEGNNIQISMQQNIQAESVSTFLSGSFTVPFSGEYRLTLTLASQPNQGLFYLDDLTVAKADELNVADNLMVDFTAFPNPVSEKLNISSNSLLSNVELYSLAGQLLRSEAVSSKKHEIDMDGAASGMYILKVISGNASKTIKIYKD